MKEDRHYAVKAFVSCSLRQEDERFVRYVCKILEGHNIRPFGTVGKFSASPENPVNLMRENITSADIVVICATPRYFQKDLDSDAISYGLSEMVHVEAGMAYALNKPVVVFVQDGTHIGTFLPNVTQYIKLNGQRQNYLDNKKLIRSLLSRTYQLVKLVKEDKKTNEVGKVILSGFAIYGGIKFLEWLFSDDD